MRVTLKSNLKEVRRDLNKKLNKKDFNKIMARAMNYTGEKIVNAERAQLHKKLDRPRPQTIKSVVISQFAKGKSNKLAMTVRVKDYASKFLHYIYSGDDEPARRSSYPSPTRDAKSKQGKFGNILQLNTKGGLLKKIDKTPVASRKGSRFQGVPKGEGSKKYGIWERQGRKGKEGLNLLVAFTPFIKHKKFINFFRVGEMVIKNNLHKELHKQFLRHQKKRGL
jgi:hypothetical protein